MTEHPKSDIHDRLHAARHAVERSEQAGANETETRELRTALLELAKAVEGLHHKEKH